MRLTPPYEGIGPGLLENVMDMCGADLLANIEATRRFLAACTRRPRTPAETETALAWNMTVPAEVREALRAREIDVMDVYAATIVPMLVTHGRDDAIVLPAMAQELLERCPAADGVVVRRGGTRAVLGGGRPLRLRAGGTGRARVTPVT